MAPSDGSYKSTGVGFHRLRHFGCPPMVRRHQDAGRRSRELCHRPDARSLSRFPPRLSLSLAFRGRTPALHTARPTAARSGGCGVSSKRRACMGRSLVLEPISRAGNADAPKRREGFAIAQRGATGRQNNGRTDFFPAEVETMKVCKKWLLYSNGENSPGKTVNCWLML